MRNGSPGRTRTYDMAVNSRPLYQLSYRGRFGYFTRRLLLAANVSARPYFTRANFCRREPPSTSAT